MNEQKVRWGDLNTVLAIAVTGSLSGASRRLGVSHATVFRRLGEIENRLGVELFKRSRTGYTPTPAGEDFADTAERIESEVLSVERRVAGRDLQPSGEVGATTTDTLLMGLLSPVFAEFRTTHPDISLEIAVSNQHFNLSKREADIAIRPSSSPPENLVGRRMGTIRLAVYGHVDRFSRGKRAPDWSSLSWVGPGPRLGDRALDSWMVINKYDECCDYRVDTLMGMLWAVRAGIGVAALPCYLCDDDPLLVRLSDPIPDLDTDLWLLTHPDLRRVARIQVFMDFIADAVKQRRELLQGEQAG